MFNLNSMVTKLLEDDDSESVLIDNVKPKQYDLKQELYPIPKLVKYYADRGFNYEEIYKKFPEIFPYDSKFKLWWKDIRQIVKTRQLIPQPIYRAVNTIWRFRLGTKEKIVYSEIYTGVNTKTGVDSSFNHIRGVYRRHIINDEYDEKTDAFIPKLKGIEKIYDLNYNPEVLDDLFEYAPPTKEQKLYVVVLGRTHGLTGLISREEFRNKNIEDLTKIALSAKGLIRSDYNIKIDTDEQKILELLLNNPDAVKAAINRLKTESEKQNQLSKPDKTK